MTNREYLATLSDDELAEWLCKQIFGTKAEGKLIYGTDPITDAMIFHTMRNFLNLEYHEGDEKQR